MESRNKEPLVFWLNALQLKGKQHNCARLVIVLRGLENFQSEFYLSMVKPECVIALICYLIKSVTV